MKAETERLLQRIIDLGERSFSVLLFVNFAFRQWHYFALKPYNMLSVLSEAILVYFMVFRRSAATVSSRPLDWFVAFAGTTLPMLAMVGGKPLAPPLVGSALMTIGLIISLWAKLIIRRRFGIAAANRGVVEKGPYGIVRHPMYAGYLFVHVGYLLMNPLARNLGLYAMVWIFQITRILAEERLLRLDPQYQAYVSRVRFRLIPGLF